MKSNEPLQPLNSASAPRGSGKFPTIDVEYASKRAVLSAARSEGSKLTLYVPSDDSVPVGTGVDLRVRIAGTRQMFRLFGTVVDHTLVGNGLPASGITVGFRGSEKRHAAEMVALCADRPPAMGTARSERQEIEFRCKVKGSHGSREGVVVDLSRTGAFIATEGLRGIKSGSRLRVQLEPSMLGLGGTWLDAKVIWQGDKGDHTGLGVQFLGINEKQAKILNKYLRTADHWAATGST